jgi:LCP family protein required for cell wall assembly
MTRRNLFLLLFSLGIGFVVCLFLWIVLLFDGRNVYAWIEKMLAPTRPAMANTATVPTQVVVIPVVTPSASATATPTPRCGGPPYMVLALLGTDSRSDSYQAGLADSIRLVRVDFIEPGIMVLPFQRDLYVEIPGIADHGITHGKLNQGYTYGTPAFGYFDGPNQGLGLMAQTMEHNFGAHVDYGIAVNMQSFVRIVDALGGIDINLPHAVDGRVQDSRDPLLYFPAGEQHLDGRRTQILARLRPQGDFERTDMQTIILRALSVKLLSPSVLPRLPELVGAFQGSVYTDLGADQIAQLTCLAIRLDPEKIVYVNFPPDLFRGARVQDPVLGNTFVFEADFDILRAYVAEFMNGTWLAEAPVTPSPAP